METLPAKLENDQLPALAPARCWAPSSYFGGCDRHRDRTDLSCCKIRRADGSPLTTADAWEEIQRLRTALQGLVDWGKTLPDIASDRQRAEYESDYARAVAALPNK